MRLQSIKGGLIVLAVLLQGAFMTSCSNDDGGGSSNQVNPDDYLYYISGKVNGEDFVYGQLVDATVLDYFQVGFGNSVITNCAYYPDLRGVNYWCGLYPSQENEARPRMSFEFVRFFLCDPDFDNRPELTFNDSFPIDSYTTAVSNDFNIGTTGAVGLHYIPDSTGEVLYSSIGESQSGNSFEITASTNANQTIGSQTVVIRQLIEGQFSFTLYNANDPSDTLEVTEGRFKLFVTFD